MNWFKNLERRFGKYAIHNLTVYLIVGYAIGYATYFLRPALLEYLSLEPYYILHGQVWRLISWILIPPSGNILTVLIMMFLYYQLGTVLERTWGEFRYNLYIFSGLLFTVLGAFLLYVVYGTQVVGIGTLFSTYYINMSIFLAFAVSFPDMQILLYFIIPVKMKWMAYVYAAFIAYSFFTSGTAAKVAIIASLLNFAVFFLLTKSGSTKQRVHQARRSQEFQRKTVERPHMTYANGAKHRCAVCGRTELDAPNLEFRYCSKCNGNYEYCQEHLFTHQHVQ